MADLRINWNERDDKECKLSGIGLSLRFLSEAAGQAAMGNVDPEALAFGLEHILGLLANETEEVRAWLDGLKKEAGHE